MKYWTGSALIQVWEEIQDSICWYSRKNEPQTFMECMQALLSLISLWFSTQNFMSLYSALEDLKLDVPSNF